jgi:cysteinyl-tRNA synthetase
LTAAVRDYAMKESVDSMAQIHFYNTLSHQVEPFAPIEPPQVFMYNCGPTVYDYAHIGNFRAFVFADVLRRFLELCGYQVHQVMNITDVGHMTEDQLADGGGEDKMEAAARRLKESKKQGVALIDNPDDPYAVASYFTQAFLDDARLLGLKIADEYPQQMPRATQYVASSMIPMIEKLLEQGHAYVAEDGTVYYDVQSFPDYGRLSGNTLEKLRGGAGGRVLDEHQAGKRNPADFLLWKRDKTHLMKWPSPWGEGYPGWHIECSAMATKVLGRDVIDIHTGGEDNIFPHHECEIAQTCGATGEATFARFWMHTRFLLVEGEKMSKSKGNFFTVRDVLEGKVTGRAVDPAVLRYELLKAHYRSNMNFTKKGLEDSASAVRKLRETARQLKQQAEGRQAQVGRDHPALSAFRAALADDLNMSGALAAVFEFVAGKHGDAAESLAVLRRFDEVLGVDVMPLPVYPGARAAPQVVTIRSGPDDSFVPVTDVCQQIDGARAQKDFATADRLRKELVDAGYDVHTSKQGTTASKRLA